MVSRIRELLDGRKASAAAPAADRLPLAATALMVEAAGLDDTLDAAERQRIGELVAWRFGIGADEAHALIAEAERLAEGPASWHGLTAVLREALDEDERRKVIEMLWDVVYADGSLHDLEASLMRRVAGLLNVTDQESGAARRRARARHGLAGED